LCYNPDSHFIIEETLSFWIQNIEKLQNELLPMTNPMWLKNKSSDIIRLHAKIVLKESSTDKEFSVLISASNRSVLSDLENLLSFPAENSRCFFAYFKKGNEWEIMEPSSEYFNAWESWDSKKVDWSGW
jgi:hypothetical protein